MAKSVRRTLDKLPVPERQSAESNKIITETLEWVYQRRSEGLPTPKWRDIVRALKDEHGVHVTTNMITKRYERIAV